MDLKKSYLENKCFFLSGMLCGLYPFVCEKVRKVIRSIFYNTEGGQFYSVSLRRLFRENHDVEIGLYSSVQCFEHLGTNRKTVIGRYCSIAGDVLIVARILPVQYASIHSFKMKGKSKTIALRTEEPEVLTVGHDVWIGQKAIIMPSVRMIGTGSVIGAGSVVIDDVEPYSVMVGNPAHHIRYRFSPAQVEFLLNSTWWEKQVEELDFDFFSRKFGEEGIST